MKNLSVQDHRGFTLIELLIVALMIGMVMGAVYSLYITHHRTAYVQDEVVEVQQNLRIAMDSIARDIRLAGYMAPGNPIADAGVGNGTGIAQSNSLPAPDTGVNSDRLTMTVGSAFVANLATIVTATTIMNLNSIPVDDLLLPDGTDKFKDNEMVTIMRQQDRSQPGGGNFFSVQARSPGTIPPTITLGGALPAGFKGFRSGDIILKVADAGIVNILFPGSVTYCLATNANGCSGGVAGCPAGHRCLVRIDNINTALSTTQVIAQNMAGLEFAYLLDYPSLPAEARNPALLNNVRAVRVKLFGETVATTTLSGGPKIRILESVIQIRNR